MPHNDLLRDLIVLYGMPREAVAGQREVVPLTLLTRNISSSGVFFLCPRWIEPDTPVELEVALVDRPFGRGSVPMARSLTLSASSPPTRPAGTAWPPALTTSPFVATIRCRSASSSREILPESRP